MPVEARPIDYESIPFFQDEGKCWYCNTVLTEYVPGKTRKKSETTIDHIIPRSKNGTNNYYNKIHCCNRCNFIKGNLGLRGFRNLIRNKRERFSHIQRPYLLVIQRIDLLIKYRQENTNKMYANPTRTRINKKGSTRENN